MSNALKNGQLHWKGKVVWTEAIMGTVTIFRKQSILHEAFSGGVE